MKIPFKRWWIALFPCLILTYAMLDACTPHNTPLSIFLVTTTLLSLWATHYEILVGNLTNKWWFFPAYLIYDYLNLVPFAFILALFIPLYSCVADRIRVAQTLSYTDDIKKQIAKKLIDRIEIIPTEYQNPNLPNIEYLEIRADGRILLVTQNPSTVIRWIPKLTAQHVKWQCTGQPAKKVPAECRN